MSAGAGAGAARPGGDSPARPDRPCPRPGGRGAGPAAAFGGGGCGWATCRRTSGSTPAARFVLPLLRAHDRGAVEVFAYADVATPDETTRRFRAACDVWRDMSRLDVGGVAGQVRRDRIDVLVDLAGHMDSRLLPVLAR